MRRFYFRHYFEDNKSFSADRWLLAIFSGLGIAGIIVWKIDVIGGKFLSEDLETVVPAVWTAATLLIYAITVRWTSSAHIEPETTGDNCYYLGFIFTLVSLAVTLFELRNLDDTEVALPEILSGLGIALSSTIVGIILRVWFFQQRVDLVARDRENQLELQKSVRSFRTSLSESSRCLKEFSTETVQLTKERDEKIRQSTENIVKMHHTALQDSIKTFSEILEESARQSFKLVAEELGSQLVEAGDAAFSELESSSKRLIKQMDQLGEKDMKVVAKFGQETLENWQKMDKSLREMEAERQMQLRDATVKSTELQIEMTENLAASVDQMIVLQQEKLEASARQLETFMENSLMQVISRIEKSIESSLVAPASASLKRLEISSEQLSKRLDKIKDQDLNSVTEFGRMTLDLWQELHAATKDHIRIATEAIDIVQELTEVNVSVLRSSKSQFTQATNQKLDKIEHSLQEASRRGFRRPFSKIRRLFKRLF